jgi:hypothetical protein
LKRTRSQITYNLYVSSWKSSHDVNDVSSIWGRTNYHLRRIDEDRTIAHAWQEEALFGSMFCACASGSCAISALVGPFSSEVTKSRERKRPCPALLFSPYFLFLVLFPPYFFPVLFFSYYFHVFFFPFFPPFFITYYFPVLFFFVLFHVFCSRIFFSRTILFPYFFKSRDVWNPTF